MDVISIGSHDITFCKSASVVARKLKCFVALAQNGAISGGDTAYLCVVLSIENR